jgi:hypothetical protein
VVDGIAIFAGGALAGAIGSLVFAARALPRQSEDGADGFPKGKRKFALLFILGFYATISLVAFSVGIALGNSEVTVIAGAFVAMTASGLVLVWVYAVE